MVPAHKSFVVAPLPNPGISSMYVSAIKFKLCNKCVGSTLIQGVIQSSKQQNFYLYGPVC